MDNLDKTKTKTNKGRFTYFDKNNQITVDLSSQIIVSLAGEKILLSHEADRLYALSAIQPLENSMNKQTIVKQVKPTISLQK